MTLNFVSILLLLLSAILTLGGLSTFLGGIAITGWWLARWLGLLPAESRFSFTAARLLRYFRHGHTSQIRKWYTWEFPTRPGIGSHLPGLRFFMELPVSKKRYIYYRQHPRELNPTEFDTYVTGSIPEIESLAAQLLELGQARGYDLYAQLCNTLAFVQQNIRYTDDLSPRTGQLIEYPKYPLETLVDKRGDCEDQSILAAALLAAMGYRVALLILPIHVALGVADFEHKPGSRVVHNATSIRYLYAETTAPNWLPGEVPPEFRGYLASGQFEVLPMMVRNDHRL